MAKMSSYPGGFLNGLLVRGVPVLNTHAGNVYWVDSGIGSNQNKGNGPERPWATLDYAIGRCTANNGDIIILAPGHAETITASNTLTLDVAGVSVVGLGTGASRPTITVSTDAAATVTISAASVSVENVVFVAALDGLNTTLTVSGAGCYLDIEHQDTSSAVEADIAITCTGDQFTCKLRDIGFTAGNQRDQSIVLTGVDNARIDIDFYGIVGTAVVNFTGTSCTDVEVRGTMYVSGTTDGSKNVVDTIGSSTWYMDVVDAAAGSRYTGGSASAVASDDITAVNTSLTTIKNVLYDTTGIASFPSAAAAGNGVSMAEVLRYIQETQIGTLTNTGGTATIGGLIGDLANISLRQRTARGIVKTVSSIATANLFTISGGMVKVVNIVGYITTAIQNQTNNMKLIMTPTGGTATDLCAVLDVDNAGQYGLLTITGTFANALALTATAGVKAGVQAAPFITSPGILSMNCSATNTGAIAWYIEYVPMDEDATITAV